MLAFKLNHIGLLFLLIEFFIFSAYFCLLVLERTQKMGSALLFILIFAWGSVSHANNLLWADQKTYTQYWLKQVPDLKSSYFYLAMAYDREGALKDAEKYYKLSLSGYSVDLKTYVNLGKFEILTGHFKEAEAYCKIALNIDPFFSCNLY